MHSQLLQRRLRTLKRSGLTFDRPKADQPSEAELQAELDTVTDQLAKLGADEGVLKAHLELVTGRLIDAEHQLWAEDVRLCLGPMNIRRDPDDPSARQIELQELHNARGAQAVMLPVAIERSSYPWPRSVRMSCMVLEGHPSGIQPKTFGPELHGLGDPIEAVPSRAGTTCTEQLEELR